MLFQTCKTFINFNFAKLQEYFFVLKENKNNIIYSTILLPELPSSTILEITMMHAYPFPWA